MGPPGQRTVNFGEKVNGETAEKGHRRKRKIPALVASYQREIRGELGGKEKNRGTPEDQTKGEEERRFLRWR